MRRPTDCFGKWGKQTKIPHNMPASSKPDTMQSKVFVPTAKSSYTLTAGTIVRFKNGILICSDNMERLGTLPDFPFIPTMLMGAGNWAGKLKFRALALHRDHFAPHLNERQT